MKKLKKPGDIIFKAASYSDGYSDLLCGVYCGISPTGDSVVEELRRHQVKSVYNSFTERKPKMWKSVHFNTYWIGEFRAYKTIGNIFSLDNSDLKELIA